MKVVRYYKPSKGGRKFYKEEFYHRETSFRYATEYWAKAYGADFFELVTIERVA